MSPFHILVASDGSPEARGAVALAVAFPWPAHARASGVVGQAAVPFRLAGRSRAVLQSTLDQIAEQTREALASRWPRASVRVLPGAPAQAIVDEAVRCRARVIVMGTRGHGRVARLVLGSVSRGVVTAAPCAVLVARGAPRPIERIAVGVDGSVHARHAVEAVARLAPTRAGRVTVVRVLEPVRIPSLNLLPAGARAVLGAEAAALHAQKLAAAKRELKAATRRLARAGWPATAEVRIGAPAAQLLRAAAEQRADLLVVGARGVGGVDRLLLGSAADAVLEQSPVPVLVAR